MKLPADRGNVNPLRSFSSVQTEGMKNVCQGVLMSIWFWNLSKWPRWGKRSISTLMGGRNGILPSGCHAITRVWWTFVDVYGLTIMFSIEIQPTPSPRLPTKNRLKIRPYEKWLLDENRFDMEKPLLAVNVQRQWSFRSSVAWKCLKDPGCMACLSGVHVRFHEHRLQIGKAPWRMADVTYHCSDAPRNWGFYYSFYGRMVSDVSNYDGDRSQWKITKAILWNSPCVTLFTCTILDSWTDVHLMYQISLWNCRQQVSAIVHSCCAPLNLHSILFDARLFWVQVCASTCLM